MRRAMVRLGLIGGAALALSACTMADYGSYGGYPTGGYDAAPPPPAYTATEVLDAYAYIDRADSLWDGIGDSPPDHSFAFEGAEPWAWQTEGGFWVVVEDGQDGIRSYYFEPGAGAPFLVVEPGHSYGFEGDAVAVVYGPDGGALPRAEGAAFLSNAVALFDRGRRLRAAVTQGQWQPVDTQAWVDTSPLIFTSMISVWDTGPQRYPEWGRYRSKARNDGWQHRIEAERLRRRGDTEAFRRWRAGGFEGPPPGRWRRPGETRPDRPNQPGAGRPGGPWRPGAARPDRPETAPAAGTPPQPGTAQPDRPRRPWGNGGARPDRPRPGTPTPGTALPGASAPDTLSPGTMTPVAPSAGERPRRPAGMWRPRPRPDASAQPGATQPGATAPQPPRVGGRPGWRGGERPDGATAPATPPTRPAWQPRPEGAPRPAWQPRPEGSTPPRRERPSFTRPAQQPRPSYSPPPQTQRPSYSPPAQTPRPTYSPPPQAPRPSYTPPRSSAPPRPAKLPSDNDDRID